MDRQALKREFPLGIYTKSYRRLYDPITAIATTVAGAATVAGAVEAKKSGKEQKEATKRAEATALAATKKQEKLALAEKKAADTKLEEQRARILKGQTRKGGLLFGSELGVANNEDFVKKTTLGA